MTQIKREVLTAEHLLKNSPSEGIRTPGLLVPNQARYQLRNTRIFHLTDRAGLLYNIFRFFASDNLIDVFGAMCYSMRMYRE